MFGVLIGARVSSKMVTLPGDSRCDVVFALVVVTMANEVLAHILHLAATKRRAVVEPSIQDPRLPCQQFNQLAHLTESHTHTLYRLRCDAIHLRCRR